MENPGNTTSALPDAVLSMREKNLISNLEIPMLMFLSCIARRKTCAHEFDGNEPEYHNKVSLLVQYIHLSPVIKNADNWRYPWPLLDIIIIHFWFHVTLVSIGWLKMDSCLFKTPLWWGTLLNKYGVSRRRQHSDGCLVLSTKLWPLIERVPLGSSHR